MAERLRLSIANRIFEGSNPSRASMKYEAHITNQKQYYISYVVKDHDHKRKYGSIIQTEELPITIKMIEKWEKDIDYKEDARDITILFWKEIEN